MFRNAFWENRAAIEEQYRAVRWDERSGPPPEELAARAEALDGDLRARGVSKPLRKAALFAFLMDNARLAAEPKDLFQDHIQHLSLLKAQRQRWTRELTEGDLRETARETAALRAAGAAEAYADFGHTVPDWRDVLDLGVPGLRERLRGARKRIAAGPGLTPEQADFFDAGETVYAAFARYLSRLASVCRARAESAEPRDAARLRFCAEDLLALTRQAPGTLHQALQLAYAFHILQEEIEGERLRSLGGLDRLYSCFMEADAARGVSREQTVEMWQDLFQKFHALTGDQAQGEPMYLGGLQADGACAVNGWTYLILNAYDALGVANPKFHIRLSKNTPRPFLRAVLDCVRRGHSSFALISDECAVPMLREALGASLEEAREYVPVGCYEPALLGRELPCTGNGGVSLPKAVLLALNRGRDENTGEPLGADTGDPDGFADFGALMEAVFVQIDCLTDKCVAAVRAWERRYMDLNPSPLFSATLSECALGGRDAYAGGAKYNSSSLCAYGNATAADSLAMVCKLVYRDRELPLSRLRAALAANWAGHEALRARVLLDGDKWGNNRDLPDGICAALCERFARRVNAAPNARGGRFKAALFSIDFNYFYGSRLGATPDGRRKGDILSRNMGAASTMDRSGPTALIESVTKLNHRAFPNGSALDLMLHPQSVAGEEGLSAFVRLIETYFERGGFAVQGNVLDAAELRAAREYPERYPNLQVRVCGWNAYFADLSPEERDEFIARAEA